MAAAMLALAGCQGDGDPAPGPTARATGDAPADAPIGADTRRRALAEPQPVGTDALFDWAEKTYAALFPQHVASQTLSAGGVVYTVRFYAGTGNYIGVDGSGGVWGYGPFTANTLQGYGRIGDFTCLVDPARCQPAPACTTRLATGFDGNLDAVYDAAAGGGAGDGADGSADGGSAGVGGSEGKVLGGRISVYRLRDGALLAQGLTDTSRGLTTLQWCRADLPVLLELQGAPGATYFDEALNALVPFPLTQKLRALVDRFDENVGVSAQTEAAYLYALNQIQGDARAVAAGTRPLATEGVPVGLTSAQVQLANQAVLAEVNRRLTERLQQVSMKALATPIDPTSGSNALPRNRYGRMAALTGGFAKLARSYNGETATPALTFSRQFALDFTDGRIDDYALDGQPTGGTGQATYRGTEAGLNWTVGQGVLGQQFGQATTRLDGDPYVAAVPVWLGYSPLCRNGFGEVRIATYYLSTIGTLTALDNQAPPGGCIWDPGTITTSRLNVLTGIRRIVGAANERAFAIGLDGSVHGWGRNGCGRVADGVTGDTIVVEPRPITGLPRVVDIVPTFGVNVALTADGDVYVWGGDYNRLSGLPENPADPLCTDTQVGNQTVSLPPVRVIATPRKVPGLSNIVSIAGRSSFVNAVRADGKVFAWGNIADAQGRVFLHPTPTEVVNVTQPRKVATTEDMSFGITAGGRVLAWWARPYEIFDQPAATLAQPQPVPGVDDVVDIVSDPLGGTLALRADGTLRVWGRWLTQDGSITVKPRRADFPVRSPSGQALPGLPRIVRLAVIASYASAVGADNVTYKLIPGRTTGDFRWDADTTYAGVPSPF